jgi:hypothetical protein
MSDFPDADHISILIFPVGKGMPYAWFNKPAVAPLHRPDEVRARAPGKVSES